MRSPVKDMQTSCDVASAMFSNATVLTQLWICTTAVNPWVPLPCQAAAAGAGIDVSIAQLVAAVQ